MRIIVADDQSRVRFALRTLLERQPDMEVVGEAVDAEDLERKMLESQPDLVLLDWNLVGDSAGALLARLREIRPNVPVIALSGRPEERKAALDAGVDRFACKCDSAPRLLSAIQSVRPPTA